MGKTELQDWLGRQVGGTSRSSSLGWSPDLVEVSVGIAQLLLWLLAAMATGCQGFDSELVSQLVSQLAGPQPEKNLEIKDPWKSNTVGDPHPACLEDESWAPNFKGASILVSWNRT